MHKESHLPLQFVAERLVYMKLIRMRFGSSKPQLDLLTISFYLYPRLRSTIRKRTEKQQQQHAMSSTSNLHLLANTARSLTH